MTIQSDSQTADSQTDRASELCRDWSCTVHSLYYKVSFNKSIVRLQQRYPEKLLISQAFFYGKNNKCSKIINIIVSLLWFCIWQTNTNHTWSACQKSTYKRIHKEPQLHHCEWPDPDPYQQHQWNNSTIKQCSLVLSYHSTFINYNLTV